MFGAYESSHLVTYHITPWVKKSALHFDFRVKKSSLGSLRSLFLILDSNVSCSSRHGNGSNGGKEALAKMDFQLTTSKCRRIPTALGGLQNFQHTVSRKNTVATASKTPLCSSLEYSIVKSEALIDISPGSLSILRTVCG